MSIILRLLKGALHMEEFQNHHYPKKVFNMEELINKKVVEHNDLIKSIPEMDAVPLKIFELAVAHLNVSEPPQDNAVYLSKTVLFSFFDAKGESKHSRFRKIVYDMQSSAIFYIPVTDGKGKEDYRNISAIEETAWNNYNDTFKIKFTDTIMPYLVELRANFTQYAITDLIGLTSKYSVLIYKWLSMNYNQFDNYRWTNKRTANQLDELKNPTISIEDLRLITNTKKKYKRIHDLEKNVIQVAQEEINKHTQFAVKYDKIKQGRSIVSIKFFIDKDENKAPLPYKDSAIIKENQEKEKSVLYATAMQSEYTTKLVENFLLNVKDLQDVDLMASLQNNVYPLYDELKERRGVEGVDTHLSYVASKMIPYESTKTNIVKYLTKAASQYLNTVKIQDVE